MMLPVTFNVITITMIIVYCMCMWSVCNYKKTL